MDERLAWQQLLFLGKARVLRSRMYSAFLGLNLNSPLGPEVSGENTIGA